MSSAAELLREQWREPSDIFTILLIIGGEIVQHALCAVSGGTLTPVAFSYGWVAYAMSTLLSVAGDGRLMLESPISSLRIINLKSGYHRINKSWTLGRLFQIYESWMPIQVRNSIQTPILLSGEGGMNAIPIDIGAEEAQRMVSAYEAPLCVAVYKWSIDEKKPNMTGRTGRDWVWWTGLVASAVQLGISIIPFVIHDDWRVFLVTAGGTLLAYSYGALPQWRKEKWASRKGNSSKNVAITLGNGSQHVAIVLGHEEGLDLEDLAGGQVRSKKYVGPNRMANWFNSEHATRTLTFTLAFLWLLLLITSMGIETHTWYLLAVGGLGLMQNLVVAAAPRAPAMLGIPIELATGPGEGHSREAIPMIFAEAKVMYTLMELEKVYPGFGKALQGEFLPGELREWEKEWWASSDAERRQALLHSAKLKEYQKQQKSLSAGKLR